MSSDVVSIPPAAGGLSGSLRVPGDKSIAHRAVMFNGFGQGTALVTGLPAGLDVNSTIVATRKLGAVIEAAPQQGVRALRIRGCAMKPTRPIDPIDCGNSGTTMRLLAGLLSGCGIAFELTGDASLRRRPMGRIAIPLREMGAVIVTAPKGRAPLRVRRSSLRGTQHLLPVASAQVKSALLLAGLSAHGRTCVTESAATRDHTELLLRAMGVDLHEQGGALCIDGPVVPQCVDVEVPGDPSSAAFFLVAAVLVAGSDIRIDGVCLNPTRIGFVHLLKRMGAKIEIETTGVCGGEAVGSLRVVTPRTGTKLCGIEISDADVPAAIDELPILAVAAAAASGRTVISGAAELRVKESDRIASVARLLAGFGVSVQEQPDGMTIHGAGGAFRGAADSDPAGDHRIVMAAAVAALRAPAAVRIRGAGAAAVSYPEFFDTLEGLRT